MNRSATYLTSGKDLRTLLKHCMKCSNITRNGYNILCHTQLRNTHINKRITKKAAYIVNSAIDYQNQIGHWFNIFFIASKNTIYLCDGLEYVIHLPRIMANIYHFCHINNCMFSIMSIHCQQKNSTICGYSALYFVAKFSTLNYKQFFNLQKLLKRSSIETNEKNVLKYVQNHFKFKFQSF